VIGWPRHEFLKTTIGHKPGNCHIRAYGLLAPCAPEARAACADIVNYYSIADLDAFNALAEFDDVP
jgi:hypothetical protein